MKLLKIYMKMTKTTQRVSICSILIFIIFHVHDTPNEPNPATTIDRKLIFHRQTLRFSGIFVPERAKIHFQRFSAIFSVSPQDNFLQDIACDFSVFKFSFHYPLLLAASYQIYSQYRKMNILFSASLPLLPGLNSRGFSWKLKQKKTPT